MPDLKSCSVPAVQVRNMTAEYRSLRRGVPRTSCVLIAEPSGWIGSKMDRFDPHDGPSSGRLVPAWRIWACRDFHVCTSTAGRGYGAWSYCADVPRVAWPVGGGPGPNMRRSSESDTGSSHGFSVEGSELAKRAFNSSASPNQTAFMHCELLLIAQLPGEPPFPAGCALGL